MTPEERNIQIEFIHNVYKSTHGVRPRHINFDSMTDQEIDEMADIVMEDAEAMRTADLIDDVYEDEDDYEPDVDELTEWYDFDPDC